MPLRAIEEDEIFKVVPGDGVGSVGVLPCVIFICVPETEVAAHAMDAADSGCKMQMTVAIVNIDRVKNIG